MTKVVNKEALLHQSVTMVTAEFGVHLAVSAEDSWSSPFLVQRKSEHPLPLVTEWSRLYPGPTGWNVFFDSVLRSVGKIRDLST
ncbi:hypothetical protein J6590_053624 [Homalodisca vitripennis]|nr:hypothetical protein J6590_053624 [Homalodisca vitripennis]